MKKQYKAEILAVGTELLLGQIANTNAQWISEQLALYGINVYNHVVVGDNLNRVADTFKQAHERSDIIIVTGGLGPTEDDLTREAFQAICNIPIVEHEPSMKKIEDWFKQSGWQMTPNNRRQARVFETATVLLNKQGMAPGMIVQYEERTWIFLPGVPREMKAMFKEDILPYLYKLTGKEQMIRSTILKFLGIGESALEHELQDVIREQTNPTIAPLATDDGIIIRLTAKADSEEGLDTLLAEAKSAVLLKVGDYFVAENDETIEQVIIEQFKKQQLTIAAAESLTGGKFTDRLISVPGASEVVQGGVVCYSPAVKMEVLGVSEQVIAEKGTVSEACALSLARNVREKLQSTVGISFTGIAGPNEVEGKQVGTVYIGISVAGEEDTAFGFQLQGDRNRIRNRAVMKGLELIFKYVKV
ncbi:competence/damage-inducible protein A [Oceanobacillus alkalisoli]|uniref:competence/damage-inducible protein A n=1 Tax=Oceanobacillus alkalisoli TaxID=2925113 RepID=UPI001EEFB36D|nr:competence/damage-inducible protein A [Oceanobacillus alkalisoli]MCF3942369.1 competence/damage-inducible protein A [Oceanobacillus alkalisoli]MCG5103426.1 competence/damage-inducible protein A [Oceanobacillus alkalisoli]